MPPGKSTIGSALASLFGIVGLSGLAGLLVAALVSPALAVTSMTANSSIGIFDALPDYIEITEQSQVNTLYGWQGDTYVPFAEVFKQNREEVGWDDVSQNIKNAVVAGEDRRFFEHGGVDLQSIVRAAVGNAAEGAIDSGASTLTMQLVKNIRIMEAEQLPDEEARKEGKREAQAPTLERKLKEAKLAISLEKKYTKNEIMLAYLNIAGFGGNTYGIESAAKQYYSKSASDVTIAEAASLIAIVQDPNKRNMSSPEKYPENLKRRNAILNIMQQLGYITKAEYDEAYNTPIEDYVKLSPPANGCQNATAAAIFCDYVIKNIKNLEALGETEAERQANWNRGGYSVYTTINLDQQAVAQEHLYEYTPADETRMSLGAAATALEPGTGRIRVMAQNKIYDATEGAPDTATSVNFNTDYDYGGSRGFPTGSTYKIFTLATWLKNGHGLSEVVNGRGGTEFRSFPASCDGGTWAGPPYKPRNSGGAASGPITVQQATTSSINVAYMSMAQRLDLCEIRDTAEIMGAHRADHAPLEYHPSSILGTNEISPLSMAVSIATIAAGGKSCAPVAVEKVVDSSGEELPGQRIDCHVAITPEVAAAAAHALLRVVQGGTGSASNPGNGIPVMGKTGTTDSREHTWMIGASTNIALAVWVGNISGHTSLSSISLRGGSGSTARHRIFRPVIRALTDLYGGERFPAAPGNLLSGSVHALPDFGGDSVESARSALEGLGFSYVDGGPIASSYPAGTVASTDPGAGARLSPGFAVTVYTSDGSLAVDMPDVIGDAPGAAKTELVAAGFAAGNISINWVETTDASLQCTVTNSNPAPGAHTSKQAAITLTVGSDQNGQAPPGCS